MNSKLYPKQPMIHVGDLKCVYTGKVLSAAETSAYNRYTADFNRTQNVDTQEFLLDQRHRYINMISYGNLAEKRLREAC